MRRPLVVLLVAAATVALAGPAGSAGTIVKFRPNLQTIAPTDLQISYSASGVRQLRFSNEIVNFGTGPLELKPKKKDCDHDGKIGNDRTALQRVYQDSNGNNVFNRPADTTFTTRKVGCFKYNKKHGHWHFEDFTSYQLYDLAKTTVVAEHSKVGFCLTDDPTHPPVYPPLPGQPHQRYYGYVVPVCAGVFLQGISIGYGDLYEYFLPGQSINIDIDVVLDGDYCLISTADPADKIQETDETDNGAELPIRITGDDVTILAGTCG